MSETRHQHGDEAPHTTPTPTGTRLHALGRSGYSGLVAPPAKEELEAKPSRRPKDKEWT